MQGDPASDSWGGQNAFTKAQGTGLDGTEYKEWQIMHWTIVPWQTLHPMEPARDPSRGGIRFRADAAICLKAKCSPF
jgi:hypothetical protein